MIKKTTAQVSKTTREFREFLSQNIVGIATGFVLGAATTGLIKSFVDDIVMPLITPLGGWQDATLTVGQVVISWGHFLSALLNFLLIALIVFLVVKKILRK